MKLTFKETGTRKISEVFGMEDGEANRLVRKLVLASLEENLTADTHRSKTQVLKDWLENDAERQGFVFETAEQFLMLGYCWNSALEASQDMAKTLAGDEEDQPEEVKKLLGEGATGVKIPASIRKEASEIIDRKIAEAIDEIKEQTGIRPEILKGKEEKPTIKIVKDKEPKKEKLPN